MTSTLFLPDAKSIERLLDLFAIVILASPVLLDRPAYRFLVAANLRLVVFIIADVCQSSLPPRIEQFSASHSGRIVQICSAYANLLRASRLLLHPGPLISGIIMDSSLGARNHLALGSFAEDCTSRVAYGRFAGYMALPYWPVPRLSFFRRESAEWNLL